jgi:hypothetical protein
MRLEARSIEESDRSWPGLTRHPSEFMQPARVQDAYPQLPLYMDGLACELEPSRCQYISQRNKALKEHWRIEHGGWSAGKERGRPSWMKEKSVQAQVEEGCRQVHCQRIFASRHGSQYFEVRAPAEGQEDGPQPVPTDGDAAWACVGREMAEAWTFRAFGSTASGRVQAVQA